MHFVIFETLSILYSCCEKSLVLNNDLKMKELSRKKSGYYDWQMIQLLSTYLHDENQFSPFLDISVGKSMYVKTPLERSDLNWLLTKFLKNHEKICFFPYSNLKVIRSVLLMEKSVCTSYNFFWLSWSFVKVLIRARGNGVKPSQYVSI